MEIIHGSVPGGSHGIFSRGETEMENHPSLHTLIHSATKTCHTLEFVVKF